MKLIFTYDQLSEIQLELEELNLKYDTRFDLFQFENYIRCQFQDAVKIISEYWDIQHSEHSICFEHNFMNKSSLAVFYLAKSSIGHGVFGLNFRMAFNDYLEEIHEENYRPIRKNVWLHELVHFVDILKLKEGQEKIEVYDSNENFLKRILLLWHYMRSEGIARMVDYLLENRETPPKEWNFNSRYAQSKINEYLFNVLELKQIDSEEETSLWNLILYRYGKFLILNTLFYLEDENWEQYEKIFSYAYENDKITMSSIDGLDIFQSMTKISLEDFIYANIQKNINLPYPCINVADHLRFFKLALIKESFNGGKAVTILLKIVSQEDELTFNDFNEILSDVEMTDEQILKFYHEYMNDEKISTVFKKLLNQVVNRWKSERDDIDRMKLLYTFSSETVFPQFLPILGNLDKMLVLGHNNSTLEK